MEKTTVTELLDRARELFDSRLESDGCIDFNGWLDILWTVTMYKNDYDVNSFWMGAFMIWREKTNSPKQKTKNYYCANESDEKSKEVKSEEQDVNTVENNFKKPDTDSLYKKIIDTCSMYDISISRIPVRLEKLVCDTCDISYLERWCKGELVSDPDNPCNTFRLYRYSDKASQQDEKCKCDFYYDAARDAAYEATRCMMQSDILIAQHDYYQALHKYYNELGKIVQANESFNFDLDI